MGLLAGGHQQRYLGFIAADHPGKIVVGEQRADHLQLVAILRRLLRAGAQSQQHQPGQQGAEEALHACPSLLHCSHRP